MEGVAKYVNDMDSLKATELRLGLPGSDDAGNESNLTAQKSNKRALPDDSERAITKTLDAKDAPVSKAQIVGWPPVRAYRKNNFLAKKTETAEAAGLYVKVSMDGAPYLRKIDIKVYKGYKELREALECMFKCFSTALGDVSGCDYAIAYEDKDGDLMLVGDVPWEMFINSCKRLRIMRGSEARGLGSS